MRFAWTVPLVAWLCAASSAVGDDKPAVGDDKPVVMELWPGKVPDETGEIGAEKVLLSPKLDRKKVEVTEPTRMVTNVTKPSITIYRPAKDKEPRVNYRSESCFSVGGGLHSSIHHGIGMA
jgi:hypothetical protein